MHPQINLDSGWNLFSQVTLDGLYNWARWSCPSANPFIVTCERKKPWTPQRLRTKSSAHLLCQETFLNLEDLIHPQDSKLTYIKAHPCSTLDALLCEFASYSSCEGKNPQRWTEAFPGQLCQSRKDYMRSQGSPETTGGLLCIFFWRQMFILVECLLSNETNLVSTTKPLKNSPAARCYLFSPHQCLLWGCRKSRGCLQSPSQSSGWSAVTHGQRFRSLSELVAPAITLH